MRASIDFTGVTSREQGRRMIAQVPEWFRPQAEQAWKNYVETHLAPAEQSQASLQGYIQKMEGVAEQARVSNIQRKQEILGLYDEMAQLYEPGGAFQQAALADIERAKTKGVGQEMQQMISSGLYGTTTAAGVGRRWESEVGAPARLKLEDISQQRYGSVLGQRAGFLERIEEPYPDYGMMAQLVMQAANRPGLSSGRY